MKDFLAFTLGFCSDYSAACGEAGDIKPVDELKLACAFYGRLNQIKFPILAGTGTGTADAVAGDAQEVPVSDFYKFEDLVKKATGRFCAYVNAVGIKWLAGCRVWSQGLAPTTA